MEEPGRLQSMGSQRVPTRHTLEKEMAAPSSVLAWRIPRTEEPDWLPSMGSHRLGHDWSDLAAAAAYNLVFNFSSNWLCDLQKGLFQEQIRNMLGQFKLIRLQQLPRSSADDRISYCERVLLWVVQQIHQPKCIFFLISSRIRELIFNPGLQSTKG